MYDTCRPFDLISVYLCPHTTILSSHLTLFLDLEEVDEDDAEWMDVKDESKILVSESFDTIDIDSILSSGLLVYLLLCREATEIVIEEEDDDEWMDVKDESKILVSESFDTVDIDSILSSGLLVYLLLSREATEIVIEEEGGETKGKLGEHG